MAVDGRQGKEILREKREERGSRKGKGKRKGKERERKKMRQEKGKVGRGKKKKMEAKGNGRRSSLFSEQIHTSELSLSARSTTAAGAGRHLWSLPVHTSVGPLHCRLTHVLHKVF